MIKIIYGGKGSGKSAKLVALANEQGANRKGIVCFLDKSNNRMHDLDHSVRLVNAEDMGINTADKFSAFVGGMLSGNYDIETIYIDCIESLTGKTKQGLEQAFDSLNKLSSLMRVNFVIAVDGQVEELPEFLTQYL